VSTKPPLFSLVLISASVLAYEILLMRLFSIIQWHHFAYMIISLALLGYGISGTLVSLLQSVLKRHFKVIYPLLLFLFSISSFSCFLLAQNIAFNPEAILWDRQQVYNLLSIFLLLSIPFVLAASAICLLFIQYPNHIAIVNGIDLLGAGVGSMGMIILLFYVFPVTALQLVAISALFAVIIAIYESGGYSIQSFGQSNTVKLLFLLTIISGVILINSTTYWQLQISPYKDLSKTLNISGTKLIKQQSSPLGLLSLVESPQIPFRFAPGLSLYNSQEPPEQLALFSDAANMTVISRYPDQVKQLSYLDQLTSALPYHLANIQQLLIVGVGGGSDILQALFHQTLFHQTLAHQTQAHQTGQVDALELNTQIIDLLSNQLAQYSGNIYLKEKINIYAEDVRGFLSKKNKHNNGTYNLIQISLMDSFNASTGGLSTLNESYLYTVDALKTYLQHLKAEGYLSISRWVKTPPRDSIKMFATAINALEQSQIKPASQHLVLIRGWQTSTLLVKKNPFSQLEINKLKQFCNQRAFDIVWYPGIKASETNQFNQFKQPWFYLAAKALLSDSKEEFLDNYKYYLYPATDDKPFFHHFFKWSGLEEMLSLRGQGGLALIEMGYIVLLATLLIAVFSSVILILLPLIIFKFHSKKEIEFSASINYRLRLFMYFFSIGIAFLFIEIAMMQKFILFLHHPIYAIPIVLTTFLIFAGLGSIWTTALLKRLSAKTILFRAVLAIVCLGLLYNYFLASFFSLMSAYPIVIKMMLSFIIIAPIALCMGMPFPLALNALGISNSSYIPWVWGVNGCASVISAVLASILAIHFGFSQVILFALGLYILCLLIFSTQITKSN
jgi:hypothetical protein